MPDRSRKYSHISLTEDFLLARRTLENSSDVLFIDLQQLGKKLAIPISADSVLAGSKPPLIALQKSSFQGKTTFAIVDMSMKEPIKIRTLPMKPAACSWSPGSTLILTDAASVKKWAVGVSIPASGVDNDAFTTLKKTYSARCHTVHMNFLVFICLAGLLGNH